MNVWTDLKPRPKGYKANNTAASPRTRSGLTGGQQGKSRRMTSVLSVQAQMPGGKRLRRALAKLEIRTKAHKPTSSPSGHGMTKPGSMTKF